MLIRSDARQIPLRDGCVQCVVTSPPYFGLRDYGVAGQIGLEQTPDAYVAELVAVFREVRRVLRDDGVCFLNLGDSYAADRGGTNMPAETLAGGVAGKGDATPYSDPKRGRVRHGNRMAHRDAPSIGLKHKDLVGIPWRVAFALQADGWWLRQDIIWAKPNPMPESVTDRCTKAHEYVFLLTKSARYFWDAEAVSEAAQLPDMCHTSTRKTPAQVDAFMGHAPTNLGRCGTTDGKRNRRSVWHIATQPYSDAHFATFPEALVEPCVLAGSRPGDLVYDPFSGSGTVVRVARRLNRRGVGTDINPQYVEMAKRRISGVQVSLLETA